MLLTDTSLSLKQLHYVYLKESKSVRSYNYKEKKNGPLHLIALKKEIKEFNSKSSNVAINNIIVKVEKELINQM